MILALLPDPAAVELHGVGVKCGIVTQQREVRLAPGSLRHRTHAG